MTNPGDSNVGRFYSERVGGALIRYARMQQQDVIDGLSETARLSQELYDHSKSDAGHGELVGDWLEMWSAWTHYSAAIASNFGMLVGALGYEIRKGKTDGIRPERPIDFNKYLANDPVCTRFWMIGGTQVLPPDKVSFRQTQTQTGTTVWTVEFDLSANPLPGMYYLEIDIGDGQTFFDPIVKYFYLDPHPTGP